MKTSQDGTKEQAEATRHQVVVAQAVAQVETAVAVVVKEAVVEATNTTNRTVIRMVVLAEMTIPVPLVKTREKATLLRQHYTTAKVVAIVIVESNDVGDETDR